MQVNANRLVAGIVLLSAVSASLAALLTHLLWGYWFFPPTVLRALGPGDRISAASKLQLDALGRVANERVTPDDVRWARMATSRRRFIHDPQARLVALIQHPTNPVPSLLSIRLAEIVSRHRASTPVEPGYENSSRDWAAVALVIQSERGQTVVLGSRSGEISNDRFRYVESLFDTTGGLRLIREETYFFEIAGFEPLTFTFLWAFAAVALLLIGLSFRAGRYAIRALRTRAA